MHYNWPMSAHASQAFSTYTSGRDCNDTEHLPTGAALLENNEASAKLTTANGGTFTSSSARLSSQSRYSTLDQRLTCFNVIGY